MTSNDDEKKTSDQQNGKRGLDRVEEMYSLADQAYGGFAESDQIELQKRRWAKKRLTHLADTNAGVLGPVSLDSPHAWIDHALTDIFLHARRNHLDFVSECIEIVRFRIREVLNSKQY